MTYLPYQQRVVTEKQELSPKLAGLMTFINSEAFAQISDAERDLLMKQANLMMNYEAVLRQRITLFDQLNSDTTATAATDEKTLST